MNIDTQGYEGKELGVFLNGYAAGHSDAVSNMISKAHEECTSRRTSQCETCPFCAYNECIQHKVLKWLGKK